MTKLRLDLNKPEFQEQLFAVKKQQRNEVRGTLKNLYQMAWKQAFVDRAHDGGACAQSRADRGESLYTLRTYHGFRAVAYRPWIGWCFSRCILIASHSTTEPHLQLVPGAGLEPAWCRHRRILSPFDDPIPGYPGVAIIGRKYAPRAVLQSTRVPQQYPTLPDVGSASWQHCGQQNSTLDEPRLPCLGGARRPPLSGR